MITVIIILFVLIAVLFCAVLWLIDRLEKWEADNIKIRKNASDYVLDTNNSFRKVQGDMEHFKSELESHEEEIEDLADDTDKFFYFYAIKYLLEETRLKIDSNSTLYIVIEGKEIDEIEMTIEVEWKNIELSKDWLTYLVSRFWTRNLEK